MEGWFFLGDIALMVLLALAIFRSERKPSSEDLGLFAYRSDAEKTALYRKHGQSGEGGRDA